VIDYAAYCQIRSLRQEQKLKAGQIAQRLQLDKKTVRYWLKHEYHQPQRPGRGSKLDPHKPLIKSWLETHHLSAQQVLQRLQAQGVQAGYTIVSEYVRLVRPKPPRCTQASCPSSRSIIIDSFSRSCAGRLTGHNARRARWSWRKQHRAIESLLVCGPQR
jgi:hypothetical protein